MRSCWDLHLKSGISQAVWNCQPSNPVGDDGAQVGSSRRWWVRSHWGRSGKGEWGDPASPLALFLFWEMPQGWHFCFRDQSKLPFWMIAFWWQLLCVHFYQLTTNGNYGAQGMVWLRIPTRLWLLLKPTNGEWHLCRCKSQNTSKEQELFEKSLADGGWILSLLPLWISFSLIFARRVRCTSWRPNFLECPSMTVFLSNFMALQQSLKALGLLSLPGHGTLLWMRQPWVFGLPDVKNPRQKKRWTGPSAWKRPRPNHLRSGGRVTGTIQVCPCSMARVCGVGTRSVPWSASSSTEPFACEVRRRNEIRKLRTLDPGVSGLDYTLSFFCACGSHAQESGSSAPRGQQVFSSCEKSGAYSSPWMRSQASQTSWTGKSRCNLPAVPAFVEHSGFPARNHQLCGTETYGCKRTLRCPTGALGCPTGTLGWNGWWPSKPADMTARFVQKSLFVLVDRMKGVLR